MNVFEKQKVNTENENYWNSYLIGVKMDHILQTMLRKKKYEGDN